MYVTFNHYRFYLVMQTYVVRALPAETERYNRRMDDCHNYHHFSKD